MYIHLGTILSIVCIDRRFFYLLLPSGSILTVLGYSIGN